jgi:hypothetical protein
MDIASGFSAADSFKKMGHELSKLNIERIQAQNELREIALKTLPNMGPSWNLQNLVTMQPSTMARVLYWNEIYPLILNVPGVICEFGVQWGASLATLVNMRAIYEPFNISRTIIGFDTFAGFPSVSDKDGSLVSTGDYQSMEGYEKTLEAILTINERGSPNSHCRKFELVKGDAALTWPAWLERNPHAIVSMACFDFDLYAPTKAVLEQLIPRLAKGALLVFDELNHPGFPGETVAVAEVLGLNNIKLWRTKYLPYCAYAVFGE